MKTFVGTKIVNAKPMNRADYNEYRNWVLPDNEEGSDDGYLVEYTDGGKSNDSRHAGYISWSPKEQFDAAYLSVGDVSGMPAHQQRVVAEKAQLDDKREKLWSFMAGKNFMALCDQNERDRLKTQADAMARYSKSLYERIGAFN